MGLTRASGLRLHGALQGRLRLAQPASGETLAIHPSRLLLVGGLRRGAAQAKDLDVLAVLPDDLWAYAGAGAGLVWEPGLPPARRGRSSGGFRHASLRLRWEGRDCRVDLFAAPESELPYALFHYTGSRAYNVRARAQARRLGWRLNQHGLYERDSGRRVRGSQQLRSEAELAARLGMRPRPPEDRER